MVSACFCSGIVCNWCERRFHRPISDYWSLPDGVWVQVPYFGFSGCGCSTPREGYDGPKLTHLPRATEVSGASEALTRSTLEWAETQREVGDEQGRPFTFQGSLGAHQANVPCPEIVLWVWGNDSGP